MGISQGGDRGDKNYLYKSSTLAKILKNKNTKHMKQIKIRVITNAKKNEVVEGEGMFKVYVNAPPVGGKANKTLIEVLAEYFKVRKSNVKIIRGEKSKEKVIEIDTGGD